MADLFISIVSSCDSYESYGWNELETYVIENAEDSSQPMASYIDPELELHGCGTHFPNPYSHAAAGYCLQLPPAIDLGGARHRYTTSFHSNKSCSMLEFLDESDHYLHGASGHDSALLQLESLARIGLKVTMLSNWWQHILMCHDSVNVSTIPQVPCVFPGTGVRVHGGSATRSAITLSARIGKGSVSNLRVKHPGPE